MKHKYIYISIYDTNMSILIMKLYLVVYLIVHGASLMLRIIIIFKRTKNLLLILRIDDLLQSRIITTQASGD